MKRSHVLTIATIFTLTVLYLFSAAPMQAKTVKSMDGVNIVYEVQGKGAKGAPALVFVHCWSCSKGFWEKQAPYFAKKYKVVTLDLAGHGESGMNRDKWTMEAYGRDVAVVVKELKLDKVILIGHSMGGPVAAEAARIIPAKVVGVIGVDTFIDVELKFTKQQMDQLLGMFSKDFKAGMRGFIGFMFKPGADPKIKEKVITDMSKANPKVAIASFKAMAAMDQPKVIKEAGIHIRCVNSDSYTPNIEAGKRHAKSFGVKLMKDVGHFLHIEKPEIFNKLMEQSIQELLKL
jgi:pimeloyl-ACP methyl ester carboxylesterase